MVTESSPVILALLVLAGCGSDKAGLQHARHAGFVAHPALSRARASDRTMKLEVLDSEGHVVPNVRVHVLADLDWENLVPKERAALRAFGSNQEKLVRNLGIEFHASAAGSYVIPEPERWAVAVARGGRFHGELSFFPASKQPLRLTLRRGRNLRLEVVDSEGTRLSGIPLRVRIDLANQPPVIQPLGNTDERGEMRLGFLERRLGSYGRKGAVVESFCFLTAKDDSPLLELGPEQIPSELLRIVMQR